MGLLRSETMQHGTLVLPVQDARKYIDKIGKDVSIQFEDMNAHQMRRPYRKFIQRIDEMERILRFIFEELSKTEGAPEMTKNRVHEFLEADAQSRYTLDEVEGKLAGLYAEFVKSKAANEKIVDDRNHTVEECEVIAVAAKMLGAADGKPSDALDAPLLSGEERKIGYAAGVIATADQARFERAIWKVSLGNALWQFEPIAQKITDPKTGLAVEKSVFVVYFQGEKGSLGQKVQKVCTAFGANMYEWPASAGAAQRKRSDLSKTLADKTAVVNAHNAIMLTHAEELFAEALGGGNSKIEDWRLFCIKEKSIYSILNMFQEGMTLTANVWFPAADHDSIKSLLNVMNQNKGGQDVAILMPDQSKPRTVPPTYIRTNEYTQGWQDIINTYGIPKYQEANPALLTIVTFPFIFGMMYGDIGHGSMLLMAGIFLCKNGEQFRYTQPAIFGARFMVLSMGIFALYAGFMYNDFFSISLNLFGSGFKEEPAGSGQFTPLFDARDTGCPLEGGQGPYIFGLDPAWGGADNELIYVNSMKMKLSVLFGVLQMFVGVCLKWSNAFHEKNLTDFIFECCPMMVFLCCFFGWMDVMILYKWTHVLDNPPNIINSLITMAMGLGVSNADTAPVWEGSIALSTQLMMYSVCAVPIMLLPKPFILLAQHKRAEKKKALGGAAATDAEIGHSAHGDHGEEFAFDEILIHQVIETIEFVLGTVSHTASYLRIWALSLAHQQLSLVFFGKTLTMGLEMSFPMNGIALYFLFAAWFGITLGVLLGMDVLECFLHTLRLHWVEFQSKFYKAGGDEFAPYNVMKLVEPSGDM